MQGKVLAPPGSTGFWGSQFFLYSLDDPSGSRLQGILAGMNLKPANLLDLAFLERLAEKRKAKQH
jgi:hypothetical protein